MSPYPARPLLKNHHSETPHRVSAIYNRDPPVSPSSSLHDEESESLDMSATFVTTFSPLASSRGHISLLPRAEDSVPTSPPPPLPSAASTVVAPADESPKPKTPEKPKLVKKNVSAPNFGNDYSTEFVKHGVLPQNWARNIDDPLSGYPKLQLLHTLKAQHNAAYAAPPVGIPTRGSPWLNGYKGSSSKLVEAVSMPAPQVIEDMAHNNVQFDVVMLQGCLDNWPEQTFRELRIDALTGRPSLLFFWVPMDRIEEARALMNQWGFRRGEDITYMVNSRDSVHAPYTHSWDLDDRMFVPTTWHCLMGLKGTMRRTSDTDLINCNVDTDVIIEKNDQRANVVPEHIYSLVENFTSMRRKLHIVVSKTPETLPVRLRPGWVTMGPSVFPCGKLNPRTFQTRTLVPFDPAIDSLRPQTPPPR